MRIYTIQYVSNFGSWSDTAINMITRIGRAKSVRGRLLFPETGDLADEG